ncbi:6-phosphogluconolactonase [Kaarinaea lacus]
MQKPIILENLQALNQHVADWIKSVSSLAIKDHGKFHIALAGGNTPRALYELLSSDAYAGDVDWQHVNFYFSDERAVPLDHEQSNFRMAHEAMLDKLSIPATNIFPLIPDLENLENSAHHYEKILKRELPQSSDGLPVFDLILLGMGADGHTASLFPGTDILADETNLVSKVYVEKLKTWRVSFTYPLLNNAAHIAILVAGDDKAGKLKQIFVDQAGDSPVEKINPRGELRWYLDNTAAKYL